MSEPAPNSHLLRSLGRLARGLSALFWGLPAALLVCAETARAEWLKPLGLLPALAVAAGSIARKGAHVSSAAATLNNRRVREASMSLNALRWVAMTWNGLE